MNKPLTGPWPVVGHDWAVELLQRSLERSGGPGHAYLFLGAPQVGKTTLARAFARALFCTGSGPRPCGVCRSCQLMEAGSHPDFRLVSPITREGEPDRIDGLLRVEQAAQIIRGAILRPLESAYKFFLIQDAHRANDSFANKLLKTLEEPGEHVILCLTAHHRRALLPTIVSRCQLLELRPLDAGATQQALIERWRAPAAEAAVLARLAHGRLGWAVEQLRTPQNGQERLERLAELRQLVEADRVERLAYARKLAAHRNSQRLFGLLSLWTGWWRDVMLAQSGCLDDCSNIDQRDRLAADAQHFDAQDVQGFLHTLLRIDGYLHHTVNTGLALDVLLLQLPRPKPSRA